MPDNLIGFVNSTFVNNRHSIVMRHYDDSIDVLGNLRRRYNYTNIVISNCTFESNDQILWINTDPVIPGTFYQRAINFTIHEMHNLNEPRKDDVIISESGFQMYDLVPNIKNGPIGRINITIEQSVFINNYGGIRALYRYHEHSNTLWHYEIRNNKFQNNKQSILRLYLPRIYRFALRLDWINQSHTINIRNNEFSRNTLFEMSIDGYYAQMNLTKNLFQDNQCRQGLFRMSGTEKDFFIYNNHVERNTADYLFEMEAKSHADNDYDLRSLFVDNLIENNIKPLNMIQMRTDDYSRDALSLIVPNAPHSYAIAIRGIQNCSFMRNILDNKLFDFEFIGGMSTNTLNSTIDATLNWWGHSNSTLVKQRVFDIHDWNNHALVNFVPYCMNKQCDSLSRSHPNSLILQNLNLYILGGLIHSDLVLNPAPVPYQVRSDLTVMPGAVLTIEPGVELEFYPNVGILVLGDLRAVGTLDKRIKMRPVARGNNRLPYYSSNLNRYVLKQNQVKSKPVSTQIDAYYLRSNKHIRFFEGLNSNEGFLQIYNATLRSWTWICDRQFTLTAGSVICNQMGKESRNVLVKSIPYYMNPLLMEPIWNQTFICNGAENNLAECDTFANYHMNECRLKGEYTYVMCKAYNLNTDIYEHAWGGVRFAPPYFEINQQQNLGYPQMPMFVKPDLQLQQQDSSVMKYVEITGAGSLHNEQNPSVQVISRTPLITDCDILKSNFHGIEFMQTKSIALFSSNRIVESLGYGINSLQLNVQTTDQKSSYRVLTQNTFSNQNTFSMIDICDSHKYYNLDQRVIVFYKYSHIARDCVKIFRTKISADNLGATGQLGFRIMQLMLVNNTVQNDTLEIYNGTLFKQSFLMASLNNGSSRNEQDRFYLSKTDSLSLYLKASIGREYFGFIAEVLVYPTSQYLSTENYIELSDSEVYKNQFGALSYVSTGERNPHLYVLRNRFIMNGFEYFNSTTMPTVDVCLQNTPKFYFGNNYIAHNYGGVAAKLHSGSGVLITSSVVYNNVFYMNKNDTILSSRGELELPYNELTVDKNIFIENQTPRSDLILISGLLSKFSRNQIIYNKGMRILFTQGFENVSTPRSQEIAFNLIRDNYAYGILNDLEDANRFRSTMVAASLKQTYHANYLFNQDNDFELTALIDPLSVYYMKNMYGMTSTPHSELYWNDYAGKYYPKDYNQMPASELNKHIDPSINPQIKQQRPQIVAGQIAFTGIINASFNYWGAHLDSEIRSRIRDKYDNQTLFEIAYSPAIEDKFRLRDGKCELGWSLIDDTCYSYIGSYVNYKEADFMCKKFESRLARETVAPIKLPRFRILARTSQFNYEGQSFRRMWLYTDASVSRDPNICAVVEDYGVAFSKCTDKLPFICEKDPVFLGAAFRFKDEIAFAIAAGGALIVCVVLLSLLWFYKSRKKKKEHLDRQNTLRTSARSHRHMLNTSSNLSTMNSNNNLNSTINKVALFSQVIGNSTDNLSNSRNILNASSRSINTSNRNQYFNNNKSKTNQTKQQQQQQSGLDQFYGVNSSLDENDQITPASQQDTLTHKTDLTSNQYHMYETNNNTNNNSNNKSYNQMMTDEDDDEEYEDDDTTTDDITDDTAVTKQHLNRFNIKSKHSPTDLSVRTTDTYAESYSQHHNQHLPVIQPRKIVSPSSILKNSKNNNPVSYDKIMNLNLDDRLLTNKINTSKISTFKVTPPTPPLNDSILSKSTTNITNISSLTNQSQNYPMHNTSDYENLSNLVIDDIAPNKFFSTPVTTTKRNVYTTNSNNLLQMVPKPPPTRPPAIPTNVLTSNNPPTANATQNLSFKLNPNEEDSDSVMSCQLITSASLLINRDSVREAKRELKQPEPSLNTNTNKPILPFLNPRHFVNTQSTQTLNQQQQIAKQTITTTNNNTNTQQLKKIEIASNKVTAPIDSLKPPPMETTI